MHRRPTGGERLDFQDDGLAEAAKLVAAGTRQVRRQQDVRQPAKWMVVRQRFGIRHIEHRAESTFAEKAHQRLLDDEAAAGTDAT